MPVTVTNLQVKGLPKQRMAEFIRRAKSFGMTPEDYLRRLVEDDLKISKSAKSTSFEQLMGPGRAVDEEEVDRLVEVARERHHRRMTRKR
jgi:hypothetical protein